MAVPVIQPAFTLGEISPSLYGRVDLARYHVAATTMRNMFVSYKGGAYSRAGTKFVGFSKQTGRAYPPRLIPFQFSINQGLALEFGNFYMRVISDGGYVLETPLGISNITRANPAVVTINIVGVSAATPIITGVSRSYAPGELVTLAGGVFSTAAVLRVTNTKVFGLTLGNPGTSGYKPNDTITLSGGTATTAAVLQVTATQVVSATVASGGSGGTNGTQTVTGTTGTGTHFTALVTVSGGAITAVQSISFGGAYTVNPANLSAEPVTGAGLTGATLNIKMGVQAFSIANAGVYTANPSGGVFSQGSTSGSGTGASFQNAIMAPNAVSVSTAGSYSSFPPNPVSQASTTGSGVGCVFNCTTTGVGVQPFQNGDWIEIDDVGGMTQINGGTYVVANATSSTFELRDMYGNNIDSSGFSAYTSGGTAARIYTVATPYAEADLPYLKYTQSADVMTLCCVNQETGAEYPPQDLSRASNTNWTFTPVVPTPSISAPTWVSISESSAADNTYVYAYVVTAINAVDGRESIASPVISISSNLQDSAGRIVLTWSPPSTGRPSSYNVYKALPVWGQSPPAGTQFGFIGRAYGTQFIDTNIVPDFTQTPPLAKNPFARGQIVAATPVNGGSGYTTMSLTINTATGSGAQLTPVIVNGALAAIIVNNPGSGYQPTDTITVSGNGSGATAALTVGPESGTYPSCPAYFQERRVFAHSLNNPDTFWMSQPGAFTNFDTRIPTISSDAITGSPWSMQVNGIQFMVPMPGGLVVLTGLQAWQLTGTGGSSFNPQPLTPATQQAQPQAYNGCSQNVPPVRIDYDILYVQAKGSIVRDMSYQFFTNIYTGTDLTLNSSHLFTGFTIKEWAWCEEPYKILWAVRDDGIMLSLTFLKDQLVAGWARHDTNGLYQSVCSVTEPPVDALYVVVQRFPPAGQAYMIERMDNRLWETAEDCWCLDCALSLGKEEPNATLTANSATGLGACTGVTGLVGGSGYSASTVAAVIDEEGKGTGAVPTLTISGGVITAVTFAPGAQGKGYLAPKLVITDPANSGRGASARIVLDNSATFTASAAVFSSDDVGSVIRMGGGVAEITAFIDSMHVTANILSPLATLPNSTQVAPQPAGSWTLSAPVSTVTGLQHLAGMQVMGLADGNVIGPLTVSASGSVTLPAPASQVTLGLGFQAQLQSVFLDTGEPTVQGQRKEIKAATARIEASRGLKIGANQPDGAAMSPMQIAPQWNNLEDVPDDGPNFPRKPYNALATPLRTGDIRIPIKSGANTRGQVCLQQDNPLPMNVLAIINEVLAGDLPQTSVPQRERQQQRQAQ